MDFNMPGMDGLKASRLILLKCPDASILMVTVFWSTQLCDEARKAGLKGVCSKSEAMKDRYPVQHRPVLFLSRVIKALGFSGAGK
jgi:DNA-binding NarL/FixJ family response regulator